MEATGKILLLLAVVGLTACEKPIIDEDTADATVSDASASEKTKKFTFTLKGDFSDDWKPVTRGYLSADGKDMTDVWVLDYKDGVLVQQIHQTASDADFGKPVMQLAYGSHHVYFIASRGTGAVLNTEAHTITFGRVLDTFYKDYEVSVVSTSNGNRAVTLDRVVTRLRMVVSDALPADLATMTIKPAFWYMGMDYFTGQPTAAGTDCEVSFAIPDGYAGKTDTGFITFGFSPADEWQTSVSLTACNAAGDVLGTVTVPDIPLKRNRSTEYTGPLFGSEDNVALSLNATWEDPVVGMW